jgi:hypothetical protein
MMGGYRKLLAAILVLGAGSACSSNEPFAFRCKTVNGVGAGSDLFLIDPAAGKAYRQTARGWERGVPVEITEERIFGQVRPTAGQVGIRYDFDRKAGTGEQFIGNGEVGVGLSLQHEDCTSTPVPGGAPPQDGSPGG